MGKIVRDGVNLVVCRTPLELSVHVKGAEVGEVQARFPMVMTVAARIGM